MEHLYEFETEKLENGFRITVRLSREFLESLTDDEKIALGAELAKEYKRHLDMEALRNVLFWHMVKDD